MHNGAWWSSFAATGYSVDNLPPAIPGGFAVSYPGGSAQLSWSANGEDDLGGYRLYRGATADFVPGATNRIATLAAASTGHTDSPAGSFYKLSAVDIHGNESGFALIGAVTGVDGDARVGLSLARPSPNPARLSAALRYVLPREAVVTLRILDAQGRVVRQLVDRVQPAGDSVAPWDLRDDRGARVPDGIYWARLEVNGERLVQRLVAMHQRSGRAPDAARGQISLRAAPPAARNEHEPATPRCRSFPWTPAGAQAQLLVPGMEPARISV